jgi:hypothetical protein
MPTRMMPMAASGPADDPVAASCGVVATAGDVTACSVGVTVVGDVGGGTDGEVMGAVAAGTVFVVAGGTVVVVVLVEVVVVVELVVVVVVRVQVVVVVVVHAAAGLDRATMLSTAIGMAVRGRRRMPTSCRPSLAPCLVDQEPSHNNPTTMQEPCNVRVLRNRDEGPTRQGRACGAT